MLTIGNYPCLAYFALQRISQLTRHEEQAYLNAPILIGDTASGGTSLHIAIWNDCTWIAHAFIKCSADVNFQCKGLGTPLHTAVRRRRVDAVQMLLRSGAHIDSACDGLGTALHAAVFWCLDWKSRVMIEFLLEEGARPNVQSAQCCPSLHLAVDMGRHETVETLLKFGADPNIKYNDFGTCLAIAIRRADLTMIQLLLDHDADPNIYHHEGAALHYAVKFESSRIVELLLKNGADPNAHHARLGIPLNMVIGNVDMSTTDRHRLIDALLMHGFDADARIGSDGTALDKARKHNDWLSMRFLRDSSGRSVDAEDFSEHGPYDNPKKAQQMRDVFLHGGLAGGGYNYVFNGGKDLEVEDPSSKEFVGYDETTAQPMITSCLQLPT